MVLFFISVSPGYHGVRTVQVRHPVLYVLVPELRFGILLTTSSVVSGTEENAAYVANAISVTNMIR